MSDPLVRIADRESGERGERTADVECRESTCEAAEPILTARGTPCRMACAMAAAAGCYAVGSACAGATVITLGGATIPCTMAVVAACVVIGPGGGVLCADSCPP